MKTHLHLNLEIPEEISLNERDAAMIIAGKLWSDGQLSYGQAAEVAGITKREFIENLSKYGYPFTNITSAEMQHDSQSIEQWNNQSKA